MPAKIFLPSFYDVVWFTLSHKKRFSKIMNYFNEAKDQLSDYASETFEKATRAAKDAGDYLQGKALQGWEKLDDDTQKAIQEVAEKTVEKKQEISGEKMYQAVMERVQKQEEYNDLLASKLDEALRRIDHLEGKLDESDES